MQKGTIFYGVCCACAVQGYAKVLVGTNYISTPPIYPGTPCAMQHPSELLLWLHNVKSKRAHKHAISWWVWVLKSTIMLLYRAPALAVFLASI